MHFLRGTTLYPNFDAPNSQLTFRNFQAQPWLLIEDWVLMLLVEKKSQQLHQS